MVVGFSEEPKLEGPALCLVIRGEPQLLGESGGALPAGNMDGIELLVAELEPVTAFKEDPDKAS